MKTLTIDTLKQSFKTLNYSWATVGPNLIGIRTALNIPDTFNDYFICIFEQPKMPDGLTTVEKQQFLNKFCFRGKNGDRLIEDGAFGTNSKFALAQYTAVVGQERMLVWSITTLPGVFYLTNPVAGGCAILIPGQYKGVYMRGLHQKGKKGEQQALIQAGGEVTVYRDEDKNIYANETKKVSKGYFGINIHHASEKIKSVKIWNWSAGCQVFADHEDHADLLGICDYYEKSLNNHFTYTLLRERELV